MKIYLVGGAVRDQLLGLPIKERDWVVVGATVSEMKSLGYRQVGKDFPVFLHPKTGEEYALARMERKVKPGYQGFTFDTSQEVTLESDLQRRDLTINAMAQTADGDLIDPFHGADDLQHKMLRHVSSAFAEDPVRILRVGRFLARYAHLGFQVADETMDLMRAMVQAGEVNALVAERVWKELERALQEKTPQAFFAVLDKAQAMPILFPNLSMHEIGMQALVSAAALTTDPAIRFAALLHAIPDPKKNINQVCHRYRAPNRFRELARLTALHHLSALHAPELSVDELLELFNRLDIFRRPERFDDFIVATQAIANAHQLAFDSDWLLAAAKLTKSVDVQAIIAQGYEGQALATKLQEERHNKIAAWRQQLS